MNENRGGQPGKRRSGAVADGALVAIAGFLLELTRFFGGSYREPTPPLVPPWVRRAGILGIATLAVFSAIVFMRYWTPPAPAQPIPFSHRIHVTTKNLNCFFCHPHATNSKNAGMPPVAKCLLCHSRIATRFMPISKITGYYKRGDSIPWVRVYRVPDFAHFSHQCHLGRGFDCSVCHGNVAAMDRIGTKQRVDMNWCVTCHWRYKASATCFTCHY